MSIVTREFRCGGTHKAYSLLSDNKPKITVNMPFQAGSDEYVMVKVVFYCTKAQYNYKTKIKYCQWQTFFCLKRKRTFINEVYRYL